MWDLIRDFFVQYIFGGMDSTGELFMGAIGQGDYNEGVGVLPGYYDTIYNTDLHFEIGGISISLADWLSTTATICVMVLICVFLYMILRYAFRLTAGLMSMR